ncbi:CpsD/CapB family tyrosine-protein kinase [Lentibacter sp. XHP0401]|uniref:CpsD/CapB family tyrosine-protein kinase n=1 Tax=Lentibacter sp. XHP0401 TaxID=2984334 RepID=UPI0021E7AA4E|nr:CpsD/CapB family tyrosine-protein kinase [Lentibacter sp. XHP0401]MCV2893676.1 CpsD/CapB family tyrosine-protein kinase [Lentibacter sp. XHP0401]
MTSKTDLVFIDSLEGSKSADVSGRADPKPENALFSWDDLPVLAVEPKALLKKRVVAHDTSRLESEVFSVLRTKVLLEMRKHGWKRIAITSPSRGCGKSFVSANLAISLSSHPDLRTVLLDLDLRRPSLNNYFGIETQNSISDALTGKVAVGDALSRIGPRLAIGVGVNSLENTGVILSSAATGDVLAQIEASYSPDLIIFDTPPMNYLDDMLALFSHTDAVILLLGGGLSTQEETETAKDLIEQHSNLLGIILNKSHEQAISKYQY